MKTRDSVWYGFLLVAGWLGVALAAVTLGCALLGAWGIANQPYMQLGSEFHRSLQDDVRSHNLVVTIGGGIVGAIFFGLPGMVFLLLRRSGLKRLVSETPVVTD